MYKQHTFLPVLVSCSFIYWPFYLFLCQDSTNSPAGAYRVLFCLGYRCKVNSLEIWNAIGPFVVLKETGKDCKVRNSTNIGFMATNSPLFLEINRCLILFSLGRLQSPVLRRILRSPSLPSGSLGPPWMRQSQSTSSSYSPSVKAS